MSSIIEISFNNNNKYSSWYAFCDASMRLQLHLKKFKKTLYYNIQYKLRFKSKHPGKGMS